MFFSTVLTLSICLSLSANAAWLIEPELGYSTTSSMTYTYGGTVYDFTGSAIPVGLRASWVAGNGFFVGLHADSYVSGTYTGNKGTTKSDTFSRTTAGLEFGYIAGKGFKVYAGYDAMNKLTVTPDTTNTNSPAELSGTGMHIGLGYYFKPHFGVDLVYSTPTYTAGVKGTTTYSTLDSTNYSAIADSSMNLMFTFPFSSK
jgi:hypothetical protein